MMLPFYFVSPALHYAMKAAAVARHMAAGMPADIHQSLMQAFYPL